MELIYFFKSIFKSKKIAVLIYLILNLLFIIAVFSVMYQYYSLLIAPILYLISLYIALSPVGEWFLRKIYRIKQMPHGYGDRFEKLFKELEIEFSQKYKELPKNIKLYYSAEDDINAFAMGKKTIACTRGFLETCTDEEFKGVISHEFAHIINRDTDLLLAVVVGNIVMSLLFIIIRVMFKFTGILVAIVNKSLGALVLTILIDGIFGLMMWIWTKIGIIVIAYSGRRTEFEADKFAKDNGYGEQLKSFLIRIEMYEGDGGRGIMAVLSASHPDTHERINRLK